MYSIKILPETIIYDYVLKYLYNFKNISNYILDEVIYNPLNNDKYILELKSDYGKYDILFNNKTIGINFNILKDNPVGLSHTVKCYEELIIYNDDINILKDFIEECYKFNKPVFNEMIEIFVFKNFLTKLNKLPLRDLNTIYINQDIKDNLLNDITTFLNEESIYNTFGIPYRRTYLFEGIPGSGKTSLIFAIASKLQMNISIFNFGPDIDDAIFMRAIGTLCENSILLLEDIDSLFIDRENNSKTFISFSGILNTLDGVSRRHKLLTFITTNHKEKLDNALLRPGRIDYIMNFTYASKQQINMIFNKFRENNKNFDEFYEKIKKNNYSIAILQKFLFTYRKEENILDYLNELEEINNIHINKKSIENNMYN